jgi:hypothetical protein
MLQLKKKKMKMKQMETSGPISIQNIADDVALKQTTRRNYHSSTVSAVGR